MTAFRFRCAQCANPDRWMFGQDAAWKAHCEAAHAPSPLVAERWELLAHQLICDAARSGREFLISDVLEPLGPHPTPGKRAYINGRITQVVAGDGLIRQVDAQKSTKQTSNKSLVFRWSGTDKAMEAAA